MAFPDPEMRKYLVNGTEETVRLSLSAHVAAGMEISSITPEEFRLAVNDASYHGQTRQPLKLTIRMANALMGVQ